MENLKIYSHIVILTLTSLLNKAQAVGPAALRHHLSETYIHV